MPQSSRATYSPSICNIVTLPLFFLFCWGQSEEEEMDLVSSDKRFGKWLKCAQAFCNRTRQTAAKDRCQGPREEGSQNLHVFTFGLLIPSLFPLIENVWMNKKSVRWAEVRGFLHLPQTFESPALHCWSDKGVKWATTSIIDIFEGLEDYAMWNDIILRDAQVRWSHCPETVRTIEGSHQLDDDDATVLQL